MKKTIISLISLSFIGLSACNPAGTGSPSTPSGSPSASVNPSANPGTGTGTLMTKQDYLKWIDCIIAKVPNAALKPQLELVKQQVNAIPDVTWNTAVGNFAPTFEAWKQAYSTLGCL